MVAAMEPQEAVEDEAETIEAHLVAEAAQDAAEPQLEEAEDTAGYEPVSEAAPEADCDDEQPENEPELSVEEELEQFKGALKALVRQGVMKRDEAQAAWSARLKSCRRS